MQSWNEYLTHHGAQFSTDDLTQTTAEVSHFDGVAPAADLTAALADGFVAVLSDQGVIAAGGAEAADFLHKQLTNDVEHLNQEQVRLAGYCSPKGRLLATLLLWRDESTIYLQLPRTILAPIQKRLQMFVMRAKVTLADACAAPGHACALGLGGAQAQTVLAQWFPQLPATPYSKQENTHGTLLRLADAFGAPRYQWFMPVETAIEVWPRLAQALMPVGNSAWRLSNIVAGVPQITLPTQEKFVPQMINFELIGGDSFKKGCYPGQEIVARSQYLGKLKRRMMRAIIADANVKAGMEVFAGQDPDQPCGMVVNAEPSQAGHMMCLAEIKTAAVTDGEIRLGSATGPLLTFLPLPYALDAGAE